MSILKLRPKGFRRLSLEARKLRQETPQIQHGFFTGADGTRIFYSVEGQGEPLIFCYGLVCSSLHWTYQIEYFSQKYQAIWMDYRGHHNSEVPKNLSSLKLDTLSDDLLRLMDHLKIKKATILGHSMGVNIVLDLYRKHPERVKALVLANGTPRRPLETLFSNNALQAGFALLGNLYSRWPNLVRKAWKLQRGNPFVSTFIGMGGFNLHLTPPEDVQLYVDQVADMDPIILLKLMESYNDYDATHWLHTVSVPTLVLGGADDKIIPKNMQELMAQLIPGSEIDIIPHGSHCPQMDLPELVNLRIEKFLTKLV